MPGTSGIVASGHSQTSEAARRVLAAGGNAFDAALGALCAATVCEPLLSSLGGGGFLMARPAGREPVVFDFFVDTPRARRPGDELDFHPILADFGTATQEFHIGMGAMAVPGVVAGLFEVRERLGTLPMAEIVTPAVESAREGVEVTDYQRTISRVLDPILRSSEDAMALVAADDHPAEPAPPGGVVRNADLADTLEALAEEGPDLFYRGDLAARLAADSAERGGQLTLEDLAAYRVVTRKPVTCNALGALVSLNAPPSPGGSLVAFSLALLDGIELDPDAWGGRPHALALAHAMHGANLLRSEEGPVALGSDVFGEHDLDEWRRRVMPAALFTRGTTHLGVADEHGNLASLTVSNGEGCAYVLPGTGIMMNNMLGEEDLNPGGFHRWPEGQRLASMMCPSVARLASGAELALGSGGSNRIRAAVLQVLLNLAGFGLPLDRAVAAPRMHVEDRRLSLEALGTDRSAFAPDAVDALRPEWPDFEFWPEPNLFFGGVHAVLRRTDGRFEAVGDSRRGGAVARNP